MNLKNQPKYKYTNDKIVFVQIAIKIDAPDFQHNKQPTINYLVVLRNYLCLSNTKF